ncbi:MAG: hypothetical protein WAR83_01620 [Flavobacteriales bacterium]|nr:hypothetical protein [Flavobacteriales bacterium]
MEVDKAIDLLQRIEKLDPPPFLRTRIDARIETSTAETPTRSWVLAGITTMALVLLINTVTLFGNRTTSNSSNDPLSELSRGMGMATSNQLYHE